MAPLAIEAFVTAWTAFYKTLDSIGFFPPQRHYVEYPPHNPSVPVPLTPQPDMPLHPLVLELLPLLPYPPNDGYAESPEIMPRTKAITYIDHRTLRWGRDPLNYYISELPRIGANGIVGTLEEGEIMLTTQSPNGMTLILDVVNGTIREYSASDMPPGPEELLAVPDDPEHPHNWPALSAVETVWSYEEKIKSLEWIPFRADSNMSFIESYAEEHTELRQILIENYGWPNAFRREDWINEKETVVKRLRDKIPWLSGRAPVPL